MAWHKIIETQLQRLQPVKVNEALMQRSTVLIDLTSLNETDTQESIAAFCEKAHTPFGDVAAVCVYPQFVSLVADTFKDSDIKTVTVANFPKGTESLEQVLITLGRALEDGVNEIDMVFPYEQFLNGDEAYCSEFVATCKAACGGQVLLKVIVETGALIDLDKIEAASHLALVAGADFIKTSTGRIPQGATLSAAAAVLLTIKQFNEERGKDCGFKVSGGIKDFLQAGQFIQLADNIMGPAWVNKDHFRIGSSKLVDAISL